MTIKINGMIQKLNPSDQYKLINIADVEGGSDLPQRTQSLETSIQVLNSNIAQKPDGLAVGSTQGQALYHDQTEIEFGTGFEVINTGTKSKVNGTTELTVSNGQEEDSTVVTGKALEFPDATITLRDPSGAQVIVVDVPQGSGGGSSFNLEVANNADDIGSVNRIEFPESILTAKGSGVVQIDPCIHFENLESPVNAVLSKKVTLLPPLTTETQQGDLNGNKLFVDPRAYEVQHAASCLLQLDSDVTLVPGHATKLYTSHEIIPTGEYYSLDPVARGLSVQDNTGGDTAVTGGELTRLLGSVAFYGKASANCNVKIWFWYKDPASPLAGGILEDVNGHPMAVEKYFNQGDDLEIPMVLEGAMMATGQAPIVMYVEASVGDFVVDPSKTLLCAEQFSDGYETSLASIEFQRRLGIESHAEIKQFTGEMLSLKKELVGRSETLAVIPAKQGEDFLNEFGVQNLTEVQASIANDTLNIQDNGGITDFYLDVYIDNIKTTMLRGKSIDYDVTIKNPQGAYLLEVYKWTGKADRAGLMYSSRNNNALNLNSGFTLLKSKFISELASGAAHAVTDSVTIPDDANNIFIILRPEVAQSPIMLSVVDFTWGVDQPFRGYLETSRINLHEQHLWFSENWAEFGLTNQGYAELRYTINNTPSTGNPMPVGPLLKGKAPVEIDNTVNQVSGSNDPKNDGAIKFLKDGEAAISKSYNLWNEQGTDNTVTFWDVLIDTDGNETKIPDSEKTFTVSANTGAPGVVYSIPAYTVEVETGQRIGGRATSNKKDGAYVQSQNISEFIVQTTVDFKELVPAGADDPYADVDLSMLDEVFNKELMGSVEFLNASTGSLTIPNLPVGAIVYAKQAFRKLPTGGIRPVTKLDQTYNNGVLQMSFGETSDVLVIIGVLLL